MRQRREKGKNRCFTVELMVVAAHPDSPDLIRARRSMRGAGLTILDAAGSWPRMGVVDMKRLLTAFVVAAFGVALAVPAAFAQSSGNFAADVESSACALNVSTGALTGTDITSLTATISVSNGNGNALLITPSLVTGLLTDTDISSNTGKNKQSVTAAIVAHVTLTRPDGTCVAVPPDTGPCPDTAGVIYDERFQQLSTNIFNVLTNCSASSSSSTACNLDLILSTLSAHGFNFVADQSLLQQGSNTLNVTLTLSCYNNGSPVDCGTALPQGAVNACVGPGTLTVQQVKVFQNSGSISD
jgi:hypothetical protein